MRMRAKAATCAALIAAAGTTAVAIGSGGDKFRADLSGFQESPVVITGGEGTFKARLNPAGDAINFELSYSGLEGGEVRQAHIHVGQRDINGSIVVWFCDSTTNPGPGDTPTCPQPSGTVTGTIEPDDVQTAGNAPQQGFRADLTADERFAKLVRALRAGVAYANVHTAVSPGGEIRGQIGDREDEQ